MSALHPIRVETHTDGSQSLHIDRFRVEWDMFGSYAVRDGNDTLAKFSFQTEAIEDAERRAARTDRYCVVCGSEGADSTDGTRDAHERCLHMLGPWRMTYRAIA